MKAKLLIIIILSLLVGGCIPSTPTTSNINNEECIPPLYNIAFPIVTHVPGSDIPRQLAPQGNWQIQDELPFPQNELGHFVFRPKQNEFWFTVPGSNKISRYFINNKQWKTYQAVGWTLSVPDSLFVANDGTVWGAGIRFTTNNSSGENYPFLSRFNDATDRFEYVEDTSGFLQIPQVRLVSNIAEDPYGLLWFFVEGEDQTLVSFDSKTGRSQQHYYRNRGGNGKLAIRTDGSVWFGDVFKNHIIQYIPLSQETRIYKGYPEPAEFGGLEFDLSEVNYLFFDHSGRLWLANNGWLDLSNADLPVWYQIIESPVFITEVGLPLSRYAISYQYSTFQSSNDWYWFTGGSGIVRLDLEKGTWCLMTTGASEVFEDSDQNLWIAVFGHLYKYALKR
ncbi:MAG: hypothetical protein HZB18_02755 [Chloroflexi bacterium]|nr:hypothetical protein [Chloroflexota bacterium]